MLGTVGLYFVNGINFGIDFTGGTIIEVQFDNKVDTNDVRVLLNNNGFSGFSVQNIGNDNQVMIRVQDLEQGVTEQLKSLLNDHYTNIDYRRVDYVGPQVGGELISKGIIALLSALLGIFLYLLIRFNLHFAFSGMICLLHDALVTVGFIELVGIEFNLSSVAAILTIVGYSINDSVVIFDRIREGMAKYKNKAMNALVDNSINRTLSRTFLTSFTTILALIPIIVLGGGEIQDFSIIVLFGIVIGTYSSVFVASPILLVTGLDHKKVDDVIVS